MKLIFHQKEVLDAQFIKADDENDAPKLHR
jgi:hypothetical protein